MVFARHLEHSVSKESFVIPRKLVATSLQPDNRHDRFVIAPRWQKPRQPSYRRARKQNIPPNVSTNYEKDTTYNIFDSIKLNAFSPDM